MYDILLFLSKIKISGYDAYKRTRFSKYTLVIMNASYIDVL